jgi:peptidoglycan/xylan/chitin deacetylase (PgdA/CDA1 family)
LSAQFQIDQGSVASGRERRHAAQTVEVCPSGSLKKKEFRWRESVAQVAHYSGALTLLGWISQRYELQSDGGSWLPAIRRVASPKFLILCYHRVGTEGIPYYCTLPTPQFEMQMKFLREHFRVVSLGQLCNELMNPGSPGNAVAVTFDDGYSDLHTYALPVLRKYEIPATVYLTADCIESGEVAWYDKIFLALQVAPAGAIDVPIRGTGRIELGSAQQRVDVGSQIVSILRQTPVLERNRFCADFERQVSLPTEKLAGRMLTWKQIYEMRSAGICFGSHTLSHPALSQLAAEDVERELRESKSLLESRLREPVLDFAFPFGKPEDCGPIAAAAAARCGYRSSVTTTWGINRPGSNPHNLRRVQLGDERVASKFGLQIQRTFLMPGEPAALPRTPNSRIMNRGRADGGTLVRG